MVGLAALLAACATTTSQLPTESGVSLERYMGTWHEQARLPNRFQKDCMGEGKAEYALNPDGTVSVTNQCLKKDGSVEIAQGVGRLADKKTLPVWQSRLRQNG